MNEGKSIGAFLALWNGVNDAALVREYETWHAFEHVPERVGSPGFAWAQRYAAPAGATAQPAYFTLYGLDSLDALRTARYQDLLDHPSDWSARMRGVLSDFRREPCEAIGVQGISIAACLATMPMRIRPTALSKLSQQLAALVDSGAAVSAILGRVDLQGGHPLDRTDASREQTAGLDVVVLLQHLRREPLQAAVQALLDVPGADAALRAPVAHYEFQSLVRQRDLPHPLTQRQPPRPELRHTFNITGDKT